MSLEKRFEQEVRRRNNHNRLRNAERAAAAWRIAFFIALFMWLSGLWVLGSCLKP
jgi:hypothetical protein